MSCEARGPLPWHFDASRIVQRADHHGALHLHPRLVSSIALLDGCARPGRTGRGWRSAPEPDLQGSPLAGAAGAAIRQLIAPAVTASAPRRRGAAWRLARRPRAEGVWCGRRDSRRSGAAGAGQQSAAMAGELPIGVELVRHGGAIRQAGREASGQARGAPAGRGHARLVTDPRPRVRAGRDVRVARRVLSRRAVEARGVPRGQARVRLRRGRESARR
jgi:hypothetical protein